jgi:hypothetical protein
LIVIEGDGTRTQHSTFAEPLLDGSISNPDLAGRSTDVVREAAPELLDRWTEVGTSVPRTRWSSGVATSVSAAMPTETYVIQLEVDGKHAEIVLGPKPTVTARISVQPEATVSAPRSAISSFLLGQRVDEHTFEHVAGDEQATRHLIAVLGRPA